MAQKRKSNALPILAIVFSGVSIILFLVHILFCSGYYQIRNDYGVSRFAAMFLNVVIITVIALSPDIFFIICASKYLGKKKSNFLTVALISVIGSTLASAAYRIILHPKMLAFKDVMTYLPEYIIVFMYFLIVLFCLIATVRLNKGKAFKVFIVLAASTGFLITAIMFFFSLANIFMNFSFGLNKLLSASIKIISDLLYEIASVFLYIALIFTALPYRKQQTIKIKIKAKQ